MVTPREPIPLPEVENPRFTALVLAGGAAPEELQPLGSEHRALIPLLGRPLAAYALTAVTRCPAVEQVALIGPAAVQGLAAEFHTTWVPDQGGILANTMAGLAAFPECEWLLICGCDVPLVTSAIVANQLQHFQQIEADIYYPIIAKDLLEKKYPGGKRTWVHFPSGTFTGGNLFLMRASAIRANRPLFEKLIAARKSPAKLAALFGLGFVTKLALGSLTIPQLERRAKQLFGVEVRAVASAHPEIGIDLDKERDYQQIEAILKDKASRQTGFFAAIERPRS